MLGFTPLTGCGASHPHALLVNSFSRDQLGISPMSGRHLLLLVELPVFCGAQLLLVGPLKPSATLEIPRTLA